MADRSRLRSLGRNLLTSGIADDGNVERRRRIVMVNIISLVAIVNLLPLGLAAHLQGNSPLGIFDHVVALVIFLNVVRLRRTGDHRFAALFGTCFAGALFLYLLATGGVEGTGHLWVYTFPLFATFLLGARGGASATWTLFFASIGVLVLGHTSALVPAAYSGEFIARFLPSFLVVFAYSHTFERLREQSQRELLQKNIELEGANVELRAKEFALEKAQEDLEDRVRARTAELGEANRHLRSEVQDRMLAEERLRQAHDRFTTVLESIDANVFATDMESHEVLFANRHLIDALGSDPTGRRCWEAVRDESGPCPECSIPKLMDEDGKPTGVYTWERRNRRTKRWYIHHDRAVRWVDGRMVRIQIATDITRRRDIERANTRLQRQLHHSQKMEALGSLAGGVAHDLNNLLSSIVGYPDLILEKLPDDSPLRDAILTMKRSGEKCAVIVGDLLTLARGGAAPRELVNLNDTVAEFLRSPEYASILSRHPGVNVDCRFGASLRPVSGSPVHLGKALMNLVINAAEAMPDGGAITLETRARRIDRPAPGIGKIDPGEYVVLQVSDPGEGIDPGDLPRIFEPFYSRKLQGRSGTGLGMAIVWNTVKDHGGHIDVESVRGHGTTFTLCFPIAGGEKTAEKPESPPVRPASEGRGETILVVDDVEAQRELCTAMLARLGYESLAVASGREAIEALSTGPVDLVLLDMVMDDDMDGLDTYRKILEVHPDQKAVIVSGFSQTARIREAMDLGVLDYLAKPYNLTELAGTVRGALAE